MPQNKEINKGKLITLLMDKTIIKIINKYVALVKNKNNNLQKAYLFGSCTTQRKVVKVILI